MDELEDDIAEPIPSPMDPIDARCGFEASSPLSRSCEYGRMSSLVSRAIVVFPLSLWGLKAPIRLGWWLYEPAVGGVSKFALVGVGAGDDRPSMETRTDGGRLTR